MITCSGTEPAIIAAMLESIRVSASVTTPTPQPSSATPRPRPPPPRATGRATASAGAARIAASRSPASMKRNPAESSGGIVRTEILIARYVEPQTM